MRTRFILFLLVVSGIFHFSGKSYFPSFENPGKERYGGVFRMNLGESFYSLFPLSVIDPSSRHIAGQVYEGLVKFDPKTLQPAPCLARSWTISPDGKTYTFHLRTDVYFHDDPCFPGSKSRRFNARDVEYCLSKTGEANPANQVQSTFENLLARDNTVMKRPLVRIPNDSTLEIQLQRAAPEFILLLATPAGWIYPAEAWDKYGPEMRTHCVGTGPFRVNRIRENEFVVLERNPVYWSTDSYGNRLPYLDSLRITFRPGSQGKALNDHEIDMMIMDSPEDVRNFVPAVIEDFTSKPPKFLLTHTPFLGLTFLGFQSQAKPFDDVRVRQAFCMAINRDVITDSVMAGLGWAAHSGLLSPSLESFNRSKSLEYDPVKAKKLLAEAGYRDGKGFPEVSVVLTPGAVNGPVAAAIQKMLRENLGVEIDITIVPFASLYAEARSGKALFWHAQWMADYPDPQAFLSMLYGKNAPASMETPSFPNAMRYKSAAFDQRYEAALAEPGKNKRMELFQAAEQIAIDDAAICPLYYDEPYLLLYSDVRGYELNAMDLRSFTEVWLKKPE